MVNKFGWEMFVAPGVQNSDGTGRWAVKRRLALQSYGWKDGRFWPQKWSFSASVSQVLIFYSYVTSGC
ncbi:hypothetical protein VN97_g8760 [Penicillium thymicola]|uniref:Uncharacterized protein n=1 Tax=Penicillium thymicola TaxID=293382 RepID=A0AAI9X5W9_PENTH|nr:hypothetical protein VN97_g8760 [Penicillium thymicola]